MRAVVEVAPGSLPPIPLQGCLMLPRRARHSFGDTLSVGRVTLAAIALLVGFAAVAGVAIVSYHRPGRATPDLAVAAFVAAMKSGSPARIAAAAAPGTPTADIERAVRVAGDVVAWGAPSIRDATEDSEWGVTIPVRYAGALRKVSVGLTVTSGSIGGLRDGWFVTLPVQLA